MFARSDQLRPSESQTAPCRPISSRRLFASLRPIGALVLAILLAACNGVLFPDYERLSEDDIRLERLVLLRPAPMMAAADPSEAADVSTRVSKERLARLADRDSSKKIEAAQFPFFYSAPLGQAYLRAGGGRALVLGEPRENCPLIGVVYDAPSPKLAAKRALEQCFSMRDETNLTKSENADCACRLVAADDVLLAPRDAFAFAPAVSAKFLRIGSARSATLIAARAGSALDPDVVIGDQQIQRRLTMGAGEIMLRDLTGPVAIVNLSVDGAATLRDAAAPAGSTPSHRGYWISEGYRRGQRAAVVSLAAPDGEKLILLVGYEPEELSAREPELAQIGARLLNGS